MKSGRCEQHQRQHGAQRRALARTTRGVRGHLIDYYQTPGWTALRDQVRDEEPFCRICRRVTTAHIDHILPREHGGSDERANLQGLCNTCHGRKTRGEQLGISVEVSDEFVESRRRSSFVRGLEIRAVPDDK